MSLWYKRAGSATSLKLGLGVKPEPTQGQSHHGEGDGSPALTGHPRHGGSEYHRDREEVPGGEVGEVVVSEGQHPPEDFEEQHWNENPDQSPVLHQDPGHHGSVAGQSLQGRLLLLLQLLTLQEIFLDEPLGCGDRIAARRIPHRGRLCNPRYFFIEILN